MVSRPFHAGEDAGKRSETFAQHIRSDRQIKFFKAFYAPVYIQRQRVHLRSHSVGNMMQQGSPTQFAQAFVSAAHPA